MGRAKEAVDVEGASTLRSFDVRLMSHLNNLSRRVHGCALVSEFTPPGKPTSKRDLRATLIDQSITSPPCPFFIFVFILVTGERIAVEYLLAQTNRGDLLLAPLHVPEVPSQVIEEEDEPDDTINMPDIVCQPAGDPPSAVEGDAEPGPLVTQVNNTFYNTLLKNTIFDSSKCGYRSLKSPCRCRCMSLESPRR